MRLKYGQKKKKNQILLFSGSITFKEESKSCDKIVYNNTYVSQFIKNHMIKYLNSFIHITKLINRKIKLYFQLRLKLCYSIFHEGNLMPKWHQHLKNVTELLTIFIYLLILTPLLIWKVANTKCVCVFCLVCLCLCGLE